MTGCGAAERSSDRCPALPQKRAVFSIPSRRLDLVHPAVEKVTLVLEGIGDGKIRVNSSSLDQLLIVLPEQAIEIVGIEKKVMVGG
jgi:hypothetical protein